MFHPSNRERIVTSGSRIRGVVFDLDNTLFDFIAMKEKAVEAAAWAMIDAGLTLSPDEIQRRIFGVYRLEGIEFQQVFDQMLKEVLGQVDQKILAAGIVAYRRVREAMLVPYPHVRSTLIRLIRLGFKLAVISDAPSIQAWLRLCYLQLYDLFDVVVTFDDTGESKPSPKPFKLALKLMKLKPKETLMVGDWVERDLVGAKKLGMPAVHARYGAEVLDKSDSLSADATIDDIRELVDLVQGWS